MSGDPEYLTLPFGLLVLCPTSCGCFPGALSALFRREFPGTSLPTLTGELRCIRILSILHSGHLQNQRVRASSVFDNACLYAYRILDQKKRAGGVFKHSPDPDQSRPKEATMARQNRSNNSVFSQEPERPIARVALYARVSTLNNQDPEMQLSELREYAERRGWHITEEYTDQGVSGCKESRPALNRLMADACRRRFDGILVWKIDRFGRSLKHLVNSLAELAALGVAFISLRDNLDLSTPSGRLMFQIIGAMAEFERALIQERVRAGLRNARAKGKRLGRPRVFVDAPRIAALRGQGRSWAEIVAQMGIGKGTAQRAFSTLPKID